MRVIDYMLGALAEALAFVLFGLQFLVVYLPKRVARWWRNRKA
jgi:preprotein translocase subunit Sec63